MLFRSSLQVDWRTPLEKLDKLADCLNQWLKTEPNRWFQPDTSVTPQHIRRMRHLEITIGIGHNSYAAFWLHVILGPSLTRRITQQLARLESPPRTPDGLQCCRQLLLPSAWDHRVPAADAHTLHRPEYVGYLPWRRRVRGRVRRGGCICG